MICLKDLLFLEGGRGGWSLKEDSIRRNKGFGTLRGYKGFGSSQTGCEGQRQCQPLLQGERARGGPGEDLVLAEDATEVATKDGADGSPGAGEALDEPQEEKVEEDVEEEVPEEPQPGRFGFTGGDVGPGIRSHEASPRIPQVVLQIVRGLLIVAIRRRPGDPVEGKHQDPPKHLPHASPEERPHHVQVHLLQLLLLVAIGEGCWEDRKDEEQVHEKQGAKLDMDQIAICVLVRGQAADAWET